MFNLYRFADQQSLSSSMEIKPMVIGGHRSRYAPSSTMMTGGNGGGTAAAVLLSGGQLSECAACHKPIKERYLLKALDQLWHEDCLKCACCDCRLGEVGSTLFTKANLILCKRDYLRYGWLISHSHSNPFLGPLDCLAPLECVPLATKQFPHSRW